MPKLLTPDQRLARRDAREATRADLRPLLDQYAISGRMSVDVPGSRRQLVLGRVGDRETSVKLEQLRGVTWLVWPPIEWRDVEQGARALHAEKLAIERDHALDNTLETIASKQKGKR